MNLFIVRKIFSKEVQDFVERKGVGHPDTLADALAERLSTNYSNYTLKKYGAVLHHNFDKVGLLGGYSYVAFGNGHMIKPIRVLINGRVSTKFGKNIIPVEKILIDWVKKFFSDKLPLIDTEKDLEFHLNLSNQSSPGKTYEKESKKSARRKWFTPESIRDIPELKKLVSNDTSLGVGYAPLSVLESLVLEIEGYLTSETHRKNNPWMGTDVKILGFRKENYYFITMCIPQIANFVNNLEEYKNNLKKAEKTVIKILDKYKITKYELNINTRDNYELRELYLTATGSSIESGDEGLVGRGNRVNGVISPLRPMSMEGSCGKNPVYHIGKLYYVAAFEIAKKINKTYGIQNEVFLASQSGRDLLDPWIVVINVPDNFKKTGELKKLIQGEIKQISYLTKDLLNNKFRLF